MDTDEMHEKWNTIESVTLILPQDWAVAADEEGDPYYYNSITGETVWDRPEGTPALANIKLPDSPKVNSIPVTALVLAHKPSLLFLENSRELL